MSGRVLGDKHLSLNNMKNDEVFLNVGKVVVINTEKVICNDQGVGGDRVKLTGEREGERERGERGGRERERGYQILGNASQQDRRSNLKALSQRRTRTRKLSISVSPSRLSLPEDHNCIRQDKERRTGGERGGPRDPARKMNVHKQRRKGKGNEEGMGFGKKSRQPCSFYPVKHTLYVLGTPPTKSHAAKPEISIFFRTGGHMTQRSNQPPRFLNYFFSTYLLIYEDTPVGSWASVQQHLPLAERAVSYFSGSACDGFFSGSSVAQLKATDPEGEPLMYGVSGEEAMRYFSVNKDTGVVWLRQQLDRETKSEMQVEFYVSDIQEVVKDTVNIQIGDVNDNAPIFHGQPYTVHIPETHAKRKQHNVHQNKKESVSSEQMKQCEWQVSSDELRLMLQNPAAQGGNPSGESQTSKEGKAFQSGFY
ncbi:Cadherin-23 Otocadherin [Collichthys lucidus]|uniref:Cadherin-23 Otocadherin n=1 Tax=Collichthys lucidus TaxID=240159 RepID=A0A4U5VBW6_COLLU|nr:Cadherin-23 Otocadherin [Collichthys lucidus]